MDAVDRGKVTKILSAAATAPSGDNSQPWRFVVQGNSIEFHYLPERDNAILNYEEGGTLIALGAAIQNAELEALAQGYAPRTVVKDSGTCVAVMQLEDGGHLDSASAPLQAAIFSRHTNRKAYKRMPLTQEMKSAIMEPFISEREGLKLSLVEARGSMQTISRALTTMEETALGNESLHELFFGDILWSETENREGKQGLYIKTLELPPPAQAMFRLLKHWSFAKLLANVGFPQMVAKTNATQNASASAFGVISAVQTQRSTYLEIGKMIERVWLLATAQGWSLQIVTGITFLARSLANPEVARRFSSTEQERVAAAHAIIRDSVDHNREPILIFRLGMGDGPTEVSYRRAPEIIFN